MNRRRRNQGTVLMALTACVPLVLSQATVHAADHTDPQGERIAAVAGEQGSSGLGHMGLSAQAWREYRAGERTS